MPRGQRSKSSSKSMHLPSQQQPIRHCMHDATGDFVEDSNGSTVKKTPKGLLGGGLQTRRSKGGGPHSKQKPPSPARHTADTRGGISERVPAPSAAPVPTGTVPGKPTLFQRVVQFPHRMNTTRTSSSSVNVRYLVTVCSADSCTEIYSGLDLSWTESQPNISPTVSLQFWQVTISRMHVARVYI